MSSQSIWLKIHRKLLPEDIGQGFLPYIWLVYSSFLFAPAFFQSQPAITWLVTLASFVVFLALYFWAHWQCGVKRNLLVIGLMCALGTGVAFFNSGASVFFVFASAFAFKVGSPKRAIMVIAGIVGYAGLLSYLNNFSWHFSYPAMFFASIVGGINIYQAEISKKNRLLKLSQEELSRVAAMAERERIARDLHDLIGHTLSMITMKTQLANKLIDKDIVRAKQELSELESISRQTLSDVRDAVTGFKDRDFASELANAKVVFQNSSIDLKTHITANLEPGPINKTLTLALREMVTNMVRHSSASACSISLFKREDEMVFTFSDNGKVNNVTMGNGLRGLNERVEEIGGRFTLDLTHGLSIGISVPL